MERKEVLRNFYTTDCNEEERFDTNHGRVEYLTTLKYSMITLIICCFFCEELIDYHN